MKYFFFNDTATTEIYTLSLHDALPIWLDAWYSMAVAVKTFYLHFPQFTDSSTPYIKGEGLYHILLHHPRSEEYTSELQSRQYLVCRLLLEKKKKIVIGLEHD